jgi:hypothetical protein
MKMLIGKPVRLLASLSFTTAMLGVAIYASNCWWLGLLFFPAYLVVSLLIDALDLRLRRTTKDPLWLISNEGKSWLDTADGHDWKALEGKRVADKQNKIVRPLR